MREPPALTMVQVEALEAAQRSARVECYYAETALLALDLQQLTGRVAIAAVHDHILSDLTKEAEYQISILWRWEEARGLLEAEEAVFRAAHEATAAAVLEYGAVGTQREELKARQALGREWLGGWKQLKEELQVNTIVALEEAVELLEAAEVVARVCLMTLWQQTASMKWAVLEKDLARLQRGNSPRCAAGNRQRSGSDLTPEASPRWVHQIPDVPLPGLLRANNEAVSLKDTAADGRRDSAGLRCCNGHAMAAAERGYQCIDCSRRFCKACAKDTLPEYGLPDGTLVIYCNLC